MALANPILLARIGAPHGVRGEVRVKSFTNDPLALGDYGPLQDSEGRTYTVRSLRPAKTVLVVRFAEIDTREKAEEAKGIDLFVDRSRLPDDTEDDEFYASDLIGMDAVSETGETLGRIVAVPDFGAGDLLEIAPANNKTWYLAFTRETVPHIDLANRRLTVRPPAEVSERDSD